MLKFTNVKINIGLDILSRRPDGYHNISTAMIPVGWSDIIEIVPSEDSETRLHCSGLKVDCPPESNLVMKAYRALNDVVELPPVDIFLHKMVPDGAGLGGGSSDATHTLSCLNEMFSLGLTDSQLADTAAGLGADCPFFVYNRPMLAEGIGELLTPLEFNPGKLTVGIVKPKIRVSTAEAYANVTPAVPKIPLAERLRRPVEQWKELIANDFEASVFPKHPELSVIKEQLYGLGAVYASMSGSGSALYGLFREGSDELSARLSGAFGGCDIFCTPLAVS